MQSPGHIGLNSDKGIMWEKVVFGASGSLETHTENMNLELYTSACTKLMQDDYRPE